MIDARCLMPACESFVPYTIGRYLILDRIAAGGMGAVYLGRLQGAVGFGRTVAVKRMHPHHAAEPDFARRFLDEARVSARIRHPNVVPTLDVVVSGDDIAIVMDLVNGETLASIASHVLRHGERVPIAIASAVIVDMLTGLHDAHETRDEDGRPLEIVHRDVSPQNVLVGADGVARVADFGIAKTALDSVATASGVIRGKLAYMPPEQVRGHVVDRRSDVYSAAVVFWELLANRRLFAGEAVCVTRKVIRSKVEPPSAFAADVPPELDDIVMRGLSRARDKRWSSALDMAQAIERATRIATHREVAAWLADRFGSTFSQRREWIAACERRAQTLHFEAGHATTVFEASFDRTETTAKSPTSSDFARWPQRAVLMAASVAALAAVVAVLVTVATTRAVRGGKVASAAHTPAATDAPISFAVTGPASLTPVTNEGPRGAPTAAATIETSAAQQPRAWIGARRGNKPAACDPPWVVDSEGVRIPKPHCF